jgi:hypothetical protein
MTAARGAADGAPGCAPCGRGRLVERELDEGVAEGHAVIAPSQMVEVPHVEAGGP